MITDISYFILGPLVEADRYIEVSDGDFVTGKQTGQVQIKMCYENEKRYIATLYNMLLALDLCDKLFRLIF